MRLALRFVSIVVVITLAWNWFQRPSAGQPRERLITMRVEPVGSALPMSVTVTEGFAVQVQWSQEFARVRFALRPKLVDEGGPINVAIASPDEQVIGDVMLTEAGPALKTETSPPFRLQVVRVEER